MLVRQLFILFIKAEAASLNPVLSNFLPMFRWSNKISFLHYIE